MTTTTETKTFIAKIIHKGKTQTGDRWHLIFDWKLPGSRFDLNIYGTEWDLIDEFEQDDEVLVDIEKGRLKDNKEGRYFSDYWWELRSINAPTGSVAPVSPQRAAESWSRPPEFEPPPNPAALGACHNHAVDFIVAGILPLPEGRELIGWIRELRDRFYRDINQAPVAPSHYCYEHDEERKQGQSGAWGHKLEEGFCLEDEMGIVGGWG